MKKLFSLLLLCILATTMSAWGEDVEVTFTAGTDIGSSQKTITKNGVTITTSNGYLDGTYTTYRWYASSTNTITCSSNIKKIVITAADGYDVTNITGTDYSAGTWSGSATSVTLKASKQVRMTKIVVTYEDGGSSALDAPTFSLDAAAQTCGTKLELTQDNAVYMYYTTDGVDPTYPVTGNTKEYNSTNGITLLGNGTSTAESVTVKAIAVDENSNVSSVASKTYSVSENIGTPTFTPNGGKVTEGTTVTIACDNNTMILLTMGDNPADPTSAMEGDEQEYEGPITINAATTIKAIGLDAAGHTGGVASASFEIGVVTLYTVTLADKNKTLTQASEGAAVTLPTRSDVGDWKFAGWSTTNNGSTQTTTVPENVTKAGSYIPTQDITLYPVYTYTETTASTATMAFSGTTTTNMTGDNEAATLGLDATQWSVIGDKGKHTLYPGLNKDGYVALYYNASGSNTVTVTNTNGATIQSIKLTFTGTNYSNVSVTVNGSAVSANADGSYTINSTSFVLGNANTSNTQVRIKSCEIIYGSGSSTVYYITNPPIPFAVTISPATGTFVVAQKVTMTTEGAAEGSTVKIYYTTDGTEPSASSTEYTEAFTVSATTTIKAYATDGTSTATDESVITISDEGLTHVKNIAEFNDLKVGTSNIVFDNPVTVLYDFAQHGSTGGHDYIWVKDATGFTQVFTEQALNYASGASSTKAKYANGDIIPAGFVVSKVWYQQSDGSGKYVEAKALKDNNSSFTTTTETGLADPEQLTAAQLNALSLTGADTLNYSNRYVLLKKVAITAKGTSTGYKTNNFSFTVDGVTVNNVIGYNKFTATGSKDKNGNSSIVTVPDVSTTTYYNIYGVLQRWTYTETSSEAWEILPLVFEEWQGESSLTLKELVTKGNAGETNTSTVYTISNKLQVVAYYADKDANVNILLVKDDNGDAVGKITKADGLNDFLINANSTFADGAAASTNATAQKDYDQSNWLEIVVPSSIGSDWVNKILAGSSVKGTYTNTLNPRLVLSSDATFTEVGDAAAYVRNAFCATNFMVKANNYQACADPTYKDEHGNFFFMTPKPCEYGQVVWGVYMAGSFFVPAKEGDAINSHAFYGGVGVNYAYNVEAGPTLTEGKIYQFRAVVKQVANSSSVRRKASADERTYEAQDEDVLSSDYIVYPFDLTSNGGYVTGADDVNTAKTVSSVRYYNMMGVESATPFDGINIVVTRYNDGSVDSFKVMK